MQISTSATSYLTAAQFLTMADKRTVARLATTDKPLTDAQLLTDPVIAQALLSASGEFESAALAGKRYSVADLQALLTAGGAGAAFVQRLVARLALAELYDFRPSEDARMPPACERARKLLDDLRHGEAVLGFAEAQDAGVMAFESVDPADVIRRNDLVTQAREYFGDRSVDVPPR